VEAHRWPTPVRGPDRLRSNPAQLFETLERALNDPGACWTVPPAATSARGRGPGGTGGWRNGLPGGYAPLERDGEAYTTGRERTSGRAARLTPAAQPTEALFT